MEGTEQETQAGPEAEVTAPAEDGAVAAPAEGAEAEIVAEDEGDDQTEGGDDLGDDEDEPEPEREGDEPPVAGERTTDEIIEELKAEGAQFYVPPAEGTDPAEAGNEPAEDGDEMTEAQAREIIDAVMSGDDEPGPTPEETAAVDGVTGNGAPATPAPDAKAEAKAEEAGRVKKSLPVMPMRRSVATELVRDNIFTAAVISVESPWEPGAERALSFNIDGDVTPERLAELLEQWAVGTEHHLAHVKAQRWLGRYVVTGLVVPDETAEGGARLEGEFPGVKVQLWAHGPAPTWKTPQTAPAAQSETPAPAEGESTGEKPALELVPAGGQQPPGDGKQRARQGRQQTRQERRNKLRSGSEGQIGRA